MVGYQAMMFDFGTQDHIFSSIQKYMIKKGDQFFKVTQDDLTGPIVEEPEGKPWFDVKMTRVDYGKGGGGGGAKAP